MFYYDYVLGMVLLSFSDLKLLVSVIEIVL